MYSLRDHGERSDTKWLKVINDEARWIPRMFGPFMKIDDVIANGMAYLNRHRDDEYQQRLGEK